MHFRVLVWNVHGFRAGVGAVAEAAARVAPDVFILNETRHLGPRLWRLARCLDMAGATGTGLWRPISNAVLVGSGWRVTSAEKLVFPRTGGTIRRGALLTTLGRAGRRVHVIAVHLGLSGGERMEHARLLTDHLAGRHPIILGGDLNESPDGPAVSWIAGRYWDICRDGCGPTFPSREPRARIDYLFVSDGVRVERSITGGRDHAALSDHLPVIAELVVD